MQTSVEWLEEQLDNELELYNSEWLRIEKIIEQAKEMEKQQIIDAFEKSRQAFIFKKDMPPVYETFEQYYNETYGSKGSDGHELDDDIPPTSKYFPTSSQTQHNSPKLENKTSFGEVSDEEIEKQAEIIDSGIHRMFFITGAKWYREQLRQL